MTTNEQVVEQTTDLGITAAEMLQTAGTATWAIISLPFKLLFWVVTKPLKWAYKVIAYTFLGVSILSYSIYKLMTREKSPE